MALLRYLTKGKSALPDKSTCLSVHTYYFTRARARILYVRNYRQI